MSPLTLCELYSRCDVGIVRVTVFVSFFSVSLFTVNVFSPSCCVGEVRDWQRRICISYHIISYKKKSRSRGRKYAKHKKGPHQYAKSTNQKAKKILGKEKCFAVRQEVDPGGVHWSTGYLSETNMYFFNYISLSSVF